MLNIIQIILLAIGGLFLPLIILIILSKATGEEKRIKLGPIEFVAYSSQAKTRSRLIVFKREVIGYNKHRHKFVKGAMMHHIHIGSLVIGIYRRKLVIGIEHRGKRTIKKGRK